MPPPPPLPPPVPAVRVEAVAVTGGSAGIGPWGGNDLNGRGKYFAGGGRSPSEDFELDVFVDRRIQVTGGRFIQPAGVTKLPRFEVSVFEAPVRHL